MNYYRIKAEKGKVVFITESNKRSIASDIITTIAWVCMMGSVVYVDINFGFRHFLIDMSACTIFIAYASASFGKRKYVSKNELIEILNDEVTNEN